MVTVVISQPFLFPWIGLFEQLRFADVFVHYDDVAFSKGSLVNRVQIKTSAGPEWMTIPLKDRRLGQLIRDLRSNDQDDWRNRHLRRLRDCYSSAPYFEEMIGLVESVYRKDFSQLCDLWIDGLREVCHYFQIGERTQFFRSSELAIPGASSDRVLQIVRHFGGRRYITGHGARNYLNHEQFEAAGVQVEYLDYQRTPYPQLHGPFDPHVSILDLIANVGRTGKQSIASPTVPWREFLARASAA